MSPNSRNRSDSNANLQYICDMLQQLKAVAGSSTGPLLPYLLDMARMEAVGEMRRRSDIPETAGGDLQA